MTIERYQHHGREVAVRAELKGKHREFCLCYSCRKFIPGTTANCPIADRIYQTCVKFDVVTPVWECAEFVEK